MNAQEQLAKEWIKKHDIVGNKAWWDGKTYYNLRIEQICSIARYINDKNNKKK